MNWKHGIHPMHSTCISARYASPLLLCMASLAMYAQTGGTGAVSGTIVDSSGGLVPGAEVRIVNAATNEQRQIVSDSRGGFFIPSLPPGSYRVTVTKNGFKTSAFDNVEVAVTETRSLAVRLAVGATQESVVVTADQAELQTESNSLGLVTDSVFVEHLSSRETTRRSLA